ncbi:MAG: hypothetical protein E6R04_06720 [Spirochaetes bacterium]|nr:MAG: hypothetical protein E6R04_06720 [Spirochaetota bacterium]
MNAETRARIDAWRALPSAENTRRRRAAVVDQITTSMSMEGEPVSIEWEQRARERRSTIKARC